MQRTVWIVLALVLGTAAATIVATSALLPATVAAHFDRRGAANGWMTRDAYTLFMVAFAVGVPLLIVTITSAVARVAPGTLNIPNRKYWNTPERRAIAVAKVTTSTVWLAILVSAFIVGVHWLLIRANTGARAHLPNDALYALLGIFAVAIVAWAVALFARFRRPG